MFPPLLEYVNRLVGNIKLIDNKSYINQSYSIVELTI